MADILKSIEAYKRVEIAAAKVARPLPALIKDADSVSPTRGFAAAINARHSQGRTALIAEIKKASPSKGVIRADFDPKLLAMAYQDGGATCLSVLTDAPSFQGKPHDLNAARQAVELPVLRKDFMYDPYQVVEARTWGADCILVIMAAVTDEEAQDLILAAKDWALDVLCEVHDARELQRALALDTAMIGINNRDLRNFETRLEITEDLAPSIPSDRIIVSESGIMGPADIARLLPIGVSAFLVGESLMRHADVAAATRALLGTETAAA